MDNLDKRIAHMRDLLVLMVDNFSKRAVWQAKENFIFSVAKEALDISVYAFRLDELIQLKYRETQGKEEKDG